MPCSSWCNDMDCRSLLAALSATEMAPHWCAAHNNVVDPSIAPSQDGNDYSCFTYVLKRYGNVILTISTYCYTPRTLQGRQMTDKSEVLPTQFSNPAYIVRQRISPFSDASSDLLTSTDKFHITTHHITSQQRWVHSV